MALHLARRSARRLLLPPFLTDEGRTIPDRYHCCQVEHDRLCGVSDDLTTKSKAIMSWSQILDINDLSARCRALDGASQNMAARFSELTLFEFKRRCHTQWGLRMQEACPLDFVPGGSSSDASIHTSGRVLRSTPCFFSAPLERTMCHDWST